VLVTRDRPWRFWVNDDDDGVADMYGLDGKDHPGSNKDNADTVVNGIRDLVDMFPLYIEVNEAFKLWPPGDGYRYLLKQADSAVTVFEGISNGEVLTTANAGAYLTDPDVAASFGKAPGKVVGPAGVELSPEFLSGSGILLVEGRAKSQSPVVLEISDENGRFVRGASFPMEIVGVEEMYGRRDLRGVAGGVSGGDSPAAVINAGGAASPYCGWGFSPYWTTIGEGGVVRTLPPSEAAGRISDAELKTHPFFRLHAPGLFNGPGLDDLVKDTGGDFVNKPVSATGLTGYYEANKAAHSKVTVRDWLLAEAFPATTLAAGAKKNAVLRAPGQNINMSPSEDDPNGFMTNAKRWPREEQGKAVWYHSDYKDVPYQHTYGFYKKINSALGGQ